jgi:hypothetical protein
MAKFQNLPVFFIFSASNLPGKKNTGTGTD